MAKNTYLKLSPKGMGLAFGVTTAISIFIIGLLPGLFNGYGAELVQIISKLYLGFNASFGGAILGAVFGFIDGFIGGYLIALFYNKFSK